VKSEEMKWNCDFTDEECVCDSRIEEGCLRNSSSVIKRNFKSFDWIQSSRENVGVTDGICAKFIRPIWVSITCGCELEEGREVREMAIN
jgi:hypothetical protein